MRELVRRRLVVRRFAARDRRQHAVCACDLRACQRMAMGCPRARCRLCRSVRAVARDVARCRRCTIVRRVYAGWLRSLRARDDGDRIRMCMHARSSDARMRYALWLVTGAVRLRGTLRVYARDDDDAWMCGTRSGCARARARAGRAGYRAQFGFAAVYAGCAGRPGYADRSDNAG